jgi:hypothetical protein
MQFVIDREDFGALSRSAQRELIELFAGKGALQAEKPRYRKRINIREPVDISEEQAKRLIHGLSDDHRRRLELFARKSGRVRMKEILALTDESDLSATTAFQREIVRRLRRLIDDPDKRAQLIAWDIDATKWDDKKTTIVDGVYYVSARTAKSLMACHLPAARAKRLVHR